MSDIAICVETVPEYGMATIWDADVLIWAASPIIEARDAGLPTSRLMAPYESLLGRGVIARDYRRLVTTFVQRIGTRETVVRSRGAPGGAPRRRIGAAPRHAPPMA